MEDFKNINITKHAIARYFGRVRGVMVTDLNYDGWKNSHHNEVEEAKMELQGLLMTSDYITTGTYGIHKKASYYIHKETLLTFVISENNLVTLYKVDYGLDLIGNKEMLEVLTNNYKRLLEEEENLQEKNQKEKQSLEYQEKILGLAIQEAEAEVQRLRAKKKELESKRATLRTSEQSIASKINTAREKIILSKKVL